MNFLLNHCVFYWKPMLWSGIILMLTCLTNCLFVLPINGVYLFIYVLLVGVATTWASFITLQKFLKLNKPINLEKLLTIQLVSQQSTEKHADANVNALTLEIDEFYIQKWFAYISKDETFNKESRAIIETILAKALKVQFTVDNQVVLHGALNLYLKHLKEFRRSLKRKEKYTGQISELYRYSHSCSTSSKAKSYFLNKLTLTLFNHFISWELANSLPYQIFISIISKTAVNYILSLLSNPEFLNYFILSFLAPNSAKAKLKLERYNRVKIINLSEVGSITPVDLSKSPSRESIAGRVETDSPQKTPKKVQIEGFDQEVKIYEPKSCKAWDDTYDLNSVTFGEDILSLGNDRPQTIELQSPISSARFLLDEMKQITHLDSFKTQISDVTVSTYHNIRDFQETTVNSVVKPVSHVTSSALSKIGGLHLQDEAAGVVEGLLDFGRTRIRRGLRLTGLQETPVEGAGVRKVAAKREEAPDEAVWINPLLEEAPRIEVQEGCSPELEYEEAGDLASSIAKLRCLLEQRSSESNLSTPCGLSPMPPDDKEVVVDGVDEADGMMPSFYKFCTKTASGVINNTLNTIKTALPGGVAACGRYAEGDKWLFVEADSTESDLLSRMRKLLSERKEYCTVDTAYEAIDSLDGNEKLNRFSSIQFEDELDDFEVRLPVTRALVDVLCELLADDGETLLIQEPVVKSCLLLFGDVIEREVIGRMNEFVRFWCCNATLPKGGPVETLEMELGEFVEVAMGGVPDYLKFLLGEKTLKDALNLFVSSVQVQRINQDVVLQIFEIVSMKLMEGSKLLSPT